MNNDVEELKKETLVKVSLLVILISNFFRLTGISIIEIGLPYIIISLSGTLVSFGLAIGIFFATQSLAQFPMAIASDRYGRKKIILLGVFVYALGSFF